MARKTNNEYLDSTDTNGTFIIWDILNKYNIKSIINTNYQSKLYALLIFPHIGNNSYIITRRE